jgi:hypothetical protein
MEKGRKVEILVNGKDWVPTEFFHLSKNDIFRMFEPDGKPVTFLQKTDFVATSEPAADDKGVGIINMCLISDFGKEHPLPMF